VINEWKPPICSSNVRGCAGLAAGQKTGQGARVASAFIAKVIFIQFNLFEQD